MSSNDLERKKVENRIIRWGPVALVMTLIFILSGKPDFSAIEYLGITLSDKIAHLVAYGILGGLIWRALDHNMPKWQHISMAVALAVIYGFTDEIHQLYVPGREFDMLDLAADAIGAAISTIALTCWMGGNTQDVRT